MKKPKILSYVLLVSMIINILPGLVVHANTEVTPLADSGAVFTKTAAPHVDENGVPDGTVDITMEAYTTGTVVNTTTTVPTDIVMVLDVSGSMDEPAATGAEDYLIQETGSRYTYYTWFIISNTGYGFDKEEFTFYYKDGEDVIPLTYVDRDDEGFEYFRNGTSYYYPMLESGSYPSREFDYPVVQMYRNPTHMEVLKKGAEAFIAETAAQNEEIANASDKHRISIVKFAGASYYNGSTEIIDANIGDNRNGTTNYTQVVKNLTVVDNAGKEELTDAMESLVAGGATAVDYGLTLAEAVLGAREDSVGRNEVVIVFTDGAPTHSNSYSSTVAGAAINKALAMKNAGVVIFSIGGANDADSSVLGDDSNRFMHYVSNNFPEASYANSTITSGTGSIADGYYMTPDDEQNLGEIFIAIMSTINHPTIEMGSQAGVIDTISPYFTLPDGANNIKLQTADRTSDGGWAPPVDVELSKTVQGNSLIVTGFDFDANHVTTVGRGENGDFYGRKLIININATPNYNVIDGDAALISSGSIPTNSGDAQLVNSNRIAVERAGSPTVNAKKVVYKIDGVPVKTILRLPGAPVNRASEIVNSSLTTKEGHTFSGWSNTEPFTMPNDDVEITGTFSANPYTVTYIISGTAPAGAEAQLPASAQYVYGTEVTVAGNIDVTNYNFSGWHVLQGGITIAGGKFNMPAEDVILYGYFTDTPYKVHHYLQNLDGTYGDPELVETFAGKDGVEVTGQPVTQYVGFTYDPGSVNTGNILPGGDLILHLYYTRNKYRVTYEYERAIPEGALALLPEDLNEYYHGAEVRVDDTPINIPGYDFSGWHHDAENPIDVSGGTFEMPMGGITLHGYFIPKSDTAYKVEHYTQKLNPEGTGVVDDYELYYEQTGLTATTGAEITASPISIDGFTHNAAKNSAEATAVIAGDGTTVLKLYYDRALYEVQYGHEGFVPGGAEAAPAGPFMYPYGATVTVEGGSSAPTGYEFVGWYRGAVTNIVTTFTMPARLVELKGYFRPIEDGIQYTVEHYLMDENGEYGDTPDEAEEFYGTILEEVTAEPLSVYTNAGYTVDTGHAELNLGPVVLDGDGHTFKIYYKRNTYNVTYEYERTVPANAPSVPVDSTDYYHGATVTVDSTLINVPGYDFSGWHHDAENPIDVSGGTFEMPMGGITLHGYFIPKSDTAYKIEHYTQKLNQDGTDVVDDYELYYEQTGLTATTGAEITASPISIDGFTHNAAKNPAEATAVIAGDGTTVLKLYYDRVKYTVTYGYEGNYASLTPQPDPLPADEEHYFGATVTVQPTPSAIADYTFVGWYGGTYGRPMEATFTMPARPVTILGQFVPHPYYYVEHYLEKQGEEGVYELDGTPERRTAAAGTEVKAYSKEYIGFECISGEDSDIPNHKSITTTVAGDGTTKIQFYYDRLSYDVTYELDGVQPYGVTVTVPGEYATSEEFGAEVIVKPNLEQAGYTFSGWEIDGAAAGVSFTMPAKAVVLKGRFTANENIPYAVEHYQQKLNTEGTALAEGTVEEVYVRVDTENGTGYAGQEIVATPKEYDGFSLNTQISDWEVHINGDGSTVLKLYYDRNLYTIDYMYYGEQPACAPGIPVDYNEADVPFGAKRTRKAEVTCGNSDHQFTGWYSPQVSPDTNGEYTMPSRNIFFTGRFNELHTVEYNFNGGTGAQDVDYSTQTVLVNTVVTIKAAPTRSGYTFAGWLDGTDTYMPDEDLTVVKDYVLTAQWTPNGGGGGGTLSYILKYESNGGTEYKDERYASGKTVELDKTPVRTGYIFTGWYSDAELTEKISSVVMKKNTTVYAGWRENVPANPPGSLNSEDHFAYIIGYPDETVRPENKITRAEVATIFFRLLKEEVRSSNITEENSFTDVLDGQWHNVAISTLAKLGIVEGRTETLFMPDEYITRAEFAAICARFDDDLFEVVDNFSDVQGHWAEDEIHEAAAHGWIKGYEDNTFRPERDITRAEAMTLINRVLCRLPETTADLLDDMTIWSDNTDETAWYYIQVQEATNSHEYTMRTETYEKWTKLTENIDWASFHY